MQFHGKTKQTKNKNNFCKTNLTGTVVCRRSSPDIEIEAVLHSGFTDVVSSKCWLQVQDSISDIAAGKRERM